MPTKNLDFWTPSTMTMRAEARVILQEYQPNGCNSVTVVLESVYIGLVVLIWFCSSRFSFVT